MGWPFPVSLRECSGDFTAYGSIRDDPANEVSIKSIWRWRLQASFVILAFASIASLSERSAPKLCVRRRRLSRVSTE
jgi:hypothetical protein